MRAMSPLMRDAGMSTRVCLAVTALRIRVSISAMGSVIFPLSTINSQLSASGLPAALGDACDVALERELAAAQAAQRELAHVGARTAAQAEIGRASCRERVESPVVDGVLEKKGVYWTLLG